MIKFVIGLSILVFLASCGEDKDENAPTSGNTTTNSGVDADLSSLSHLTVRINALPAGETRHYQVELGVTGNVSYEVDQQPSWLRINDQGLITMSPAQADIGEYTFEVTAVSNGIRVSSGPIHVRVKTINENIRDRIIAAANIPIENIVEPVRTVTKNSLLKVPNPDGNSWDLLQVYFKEYGGPNEIVIIDTGSGEVKHVIQNSTYRNWQRNGSVIAPNGKLYIGTIVRPSLQPVINVYDPATNTLTMDVITLPSELDGEVNPMELGTDGNIYLASGDMDQRAHVIQINSSNHAVTDFGPMGPSQSPATIKTERVCSDKDNVYVVSGQVPFHLVGMNKLTKEETVYKTSSNRIGMMQSEFGCVAWSDDIMYFLYQGQAIVATNGLDSIPPWPIPSYRAGENTLSPMRTVVDLPPMPEVVDQNANVDKDGNAELWVNWNDKWTSYKYPLQTYAQEISRIFTMSDGRIFGTGKAYTGNFIFDPTTDNVEFLGKNLLSHYATAEKDGKLYMSGYPSSSTYVFDVSKSWTQMLNDWSPGKEVLAFDDPGLNPKFLGYFRDYSGAHATKSMVVGADGFIYLGGEWRRDGVGGGLSWFNPETNERGGLSTPFTQYQIHNLAAVNNGRQIVISTKGVEDYVTGQVAPAFGKLFVFDTASKRIIGSYTPIKTSITTGEIIATDGPYILGISTNDTHDQMYIYRFNANNGQLDYSLSVDATSLFRTQFEYQGGSTVALDHKGYVWTYMIGRLVKVDPVSGDIIPIGLTTRDDGLNSGQVGGLCFSGDDLYFSSGDDVSNYLRRVGGATNY